ncbi:uncharacterized protein [Linepithema humile]|nr:PREDICTED: uncharacterized protein LOC105676863 isoform X2 [Linepithema humile]XP_012230486.1 PREDICTED: uncharacterized protein LOC105676863 isoform X2 [Linepithema humile]
MKILKHIPANNRSSTHTHTIFDNCQIYLNLGCNIVNVEKNLINEHNKFYSKSEFNHQSIETFENFFSGIISEFSEKLVHRINLSGHTETNFYVDANTIGIIINISGNLTRAAFTISSNRTMQRPGITMSLAHTYDKKGVAIGARNLSGGWCMKLTGVTNSTYSFDVVAYFETNETSTKNEIIDIKSTNEYTNFNEKEEEDIILNKANEAIINKTRQFSKLEKESRKSNVNTNDFTLLINPEINKKSKFVFERSAEREMINPRLLHGKINNDETVDFSDMSLSSKSMENITNYFILHNRSLTSYGDFKISQNILSNKKTALEKQQKIQARSSEVASLNEDIDTNMKPSTFSSETILTQMKDNENQELSALEFANNEQFSERKKMLLEISANSNLIVVPPSQSPGIRHRVTFDLLNSCILPVKYAIRAKSSPLRIYAIQPIFMWLYPGQKGHVAVDILVPFGTQDLVNTLSLSIDGTEISEKTAYIYVRNSFSKSIDDVKPTIEYSFNSNCAGKLDKSRCDKTLWSADIIVEDYDSGLKRVLSSPNEIYPRSTFISGTKERISFTYWSTCCSPTAKITAIDVFDNRYSRTIDVTAWDNLSQGEIAAITLGALLLLILLILLIVAIVYCVRRRSSHELPRYSSRQPIRSERTSF